MSCTSKCRWPMTRRAASRITAKDSMRSWLRASSTSSGPALAIRSRNSTVLCCKASSLRASISGSRALMSGTSDWRALSFFPSPARSTRLNKDMGASVLAGPGYGRGALRRSAGHHVHVVAQVHRHPPVIGDRRPEGLGHSPDGGDGGADLAQEIVDRDHVGVMADALDAEARLLEEPADAGAVEVVEVHVHQPGPVPPHHAGDTAADVDGRQVQVPAGLHEAEGGLELGAGVLEVLDHVPHGDDVIAVAAGRPFTDGLVVHGETQGAGLGDCPRRKLGPLGAEAGLAGDVDEVAAVGADVGQAP